MVFKTIEPQFWKPESEGDEITGVLLRVDEDAGKFKSKIYHIETENGKQISLFGSTVLDDKISYVTIGDKIKIVFKGKVKGKDSEYNNYEVQKDYKEK